MKVILITGRIGSGKSTVADYLKSKGYNVIKADDYAKRLYNDNWELKFHILKYFGPEAITSLDGINLDFLNHNIFKQENKEYRKVIELCIFKYFKEDLKIILDAFGETRKFSTVFIEAPETELVINESKALPFYSNKIVVRISDNKERFNRIWKRNPEMTFMDIKERDNAQIDSELEECDILINNDSRNKDNLIKQVNELILNEKHQ